MHHASHVTRQATTFFDGQRHHGLLPQVPIDKRIHPGTSLFGPLPWQPHDLFTSIWHQHPRFSCLAACELAEQGSLLAASQQLVVRLPQPATSSSTKVETHALLWVWSRFFLANKDHQGPPHLGAEPLLSVHCITFPTFTLFFSSSEAASPEQAFSPSVSVFLALVRTLNKPPRRDTGYTFYFFWSSFIYPLNLV